MKTPASLPRIAIMLAVVVVTVLLGGCLKKQTPPTPPPPPPVTPVVDAEKDALATVTTYLQALDDRDFANAYEMLSRASQSKHTRAAYEQQAKSGGMTSFDLTTATATVSGDKARVEIRQTEDPATHGFYLVKEDGAWKVEYWDGVPYQPNPQTSW